MKDLLILLLLQLLNGFFAMYEIALVSSSRVRIAALAEGGSRRARLVARQQREPEQTLSTIQVGITLIGIVSGAFGGMTLAGETRQLLELVLPLAAWADALAVPLTIAAITYLSLVVGELVPKAIALSHPERWAMRMSVPIAALTWVCYPVVWLLSASTKAAGRLLRIKPAPEPSMTGEELRLMLRAGAVGGTGAAERQVLYEAARFADRSVRELMTPRADIVALSRGDSREQVVATIGREGYSKYLLVGQTKDEVVGVVAVKDVVPLLGGQNEWRTDTLERICRPALFLPENIQATKALELLKAHGTKMGVVVDEYGGTEGLVTLGDLAGSIVGSVTEPGEEPEQEVVERADGSLLVDGAMNLHDFMDRMGQRLSPEVEAQDFTTLGGLAMYVLQRLPRTGDRFDFQGLSIEVVDMDGERIDKLLVTKHES